MGVGGVHRSCLAPRKHRVQSVLVSREPCAVMEMEVLGRGRKRASSFSPGVTLPLGARVGWNCQSLEERPLAVSKENQGLSD